MIQYILPIAILLSTGCAATLPPSDELKAKLLQPEDPALRAHVREELSGAGAEIAVCNRDGEKYGRPLDAGERLIAEEIGIREIDKIRVVTGSRWWEKYPAWLVSGIQGETCNYTMYFSPVGIHTVFRHELFHIFQMERHGGTPIEWYVEYHAMAARTGYMMNPYEREAEGVPFNTDNRALR